MSQKYIQGLAFRQLNVKVTRMVGGAAKTVDETSGDKFCLFNDCHLSAFPDDRNFTDSKNMSYEIQTTW
jgi:hypothetical protein